MFSFSKSEYRHKYLYFKILYLFSIQMQKNVLKIWALRYKVHNEGHILKDQGLQPCVPRHLL